MRAKAFLAGGLSRHGRDCWCRYCAKQSIPNCSALHTLEPVNGLWVARCFCGWSTAPQDTISATLGVESHTRLRHFTGGVL